jgi:hypothetical protein
MDVKRLRKALGVEEETKVPNSSLHIPILLLKNN